MALPEAHKRNFDTLVEAIRKHRVALVEVKHVETGTLHAAICALNYDKDGGAEFVPFATLIDGDPYLQYAPPDPDDKHGFVLPGGDVPQ